METYLIRCRGFERLNSGGGKTFKRGPFTLSSVCVVIFSDSNCVSCVCVCVCVCVRERERECGVCVCV